MEFSTFGDFKSLMTLLRHNQPHSGLILVLSSIFFAHFSLFKTRNCLCQHIYSRVLQFDLSMCLKGIDRPHWAPWRTRRCSPHLPVMCAGSPIDAANAVLHANAYARISTCLPTCRPRVRGRPAVVAVLPVGGAVGGVAVLAVLLLAVGGPVLLWLPAVCHSCLLGNRGGDGSPAGDGGRGGEEEMRLKKINK